MAAISLYRRGMVSALLELASTDDAEGFCAALHAAGGVELADEMALWPGPSKVKEPRTPLMVAATNGSAAVVALLLRLPCVDVNRRAAIDGATALHCATSGGSPNAAAVVCALLAGGADWSVRDSAGRVPADVVRAHPAAVNGLAACLAPLLPRCTSGRKEYPADPTLPDLSRGLYASDYFRMYVFKVRPCARAYVHDWTACPFAHPGENARRRDPRLSSYTAVPCNSFRLPGGCPRGDGCAFAHGVFESWLHPAQYRTKPCIDGYACTRPICFFAHAEHELRHVPRDDTGSCVISPRALSDMAAAAALGGGTRSVAAAQRLLVASMNSARSWPSSSSTGHHGPALTSGSRLKLPAIAPPPTYMAALPSSSSSGNDHGSPVGASTSQLLARIRQQLGVS